jgi:hypothetical protein
MKNLLFTSLLSLAIIFSISSCSKTSPALSGTLTGFVTTYDQYGFKVLSDISGVSVHISDGAHDSSTTNASGQYTFSNLSTGSYNISYSKAGYGTVNAYDYGFTGGGTLNRNASISKIPSFSLYNVTDTIETVSTELGVLIRGVDTADQVARSFTVFGSASSAVSSSPGSYTYANTGTIKAGQTTWSLFITSEELHENGLASGSTVYFMVYPYSTGAPTYADPTTGRTTYTALGTPATVLSIVIP